MCRPISLQGALNQKSNAPALLFLCGEDRARTDDLLAASQAL